MVTTLILVRHGRTAWNKEERFRGRTDLPLDDVGLRQAKAVAQRIATDYRPVAVYASPLQRGMHTAQVIAEPLGLAAQPHQGLIDLNYGALAGLSPAEAEERFPALYQAWLSAPQTVHFPAGESLDAVRERVMALVQDVVQGEQGQQIVLVSHLVVCRVLLCALLDVGNDHFWRFRVDPASLTVFEWDRGRATLRTANDICHLERLSG